MTNGLPAHYTLTRTTPTFDNTTVPAGLLSTHRVADGVWGRLVVHSGQVTFVFEDQPDMPVDVTAGGYIDIPPALPHHLELDEPATFAVEFYRPASTEPDDITGHESTGLRPDL